MLRYGMLLPLILTPVLVFAQAGGDLQARIEYAYESEDPNQLATLIETLRTQERAGGADPALRYHLAHAHYRSGQLAELRQAHTAPADFTECVDELKPLVDRDAPSADSLALQSACYASLAPLRPIQGALLRARAAERLRAAQKLKPRNPRVVFLSALGTLRRAPAGSADAAAGFAELQSAVHLFEASPATADDLPGWGHADAYLEFGRRLQSGGDARSARDWIEKALLAAPDFKAAQRQMASLALH